MPSKTKCSICLNTAILAQVDNLLDSGTPQKQIAEMFNISKFSISRHVNNCRRPAESPEDIGLWLSRADLLFRQAQADSDMRGAVQSLTVGLRALEARAKEQERNAEATEEGEVDDRVDIQDLDSMIALFDQVEPSPVDQPKISIALAKARSLNRMDAVSIFFRMWENSAFAQDLTDYATSWKSEEKGKADEPVLEKVSAPN